MTKVNLITLKKNNIDDFAKERNLLLRSSKYKWNLFLDSDEKIDGYDFDLDDKYSGYYLVRKNYFINNYVGSDKIVRLVQKNTGEFRRKVHEKWFNYPEYKIGFIRKLIVHNTATSLSQYINKINKYSSIHAIENLNEGKKVSLIKIILLPILKFLVTYLKSKNVVFSIMQSFHSFLAWSKLWTKLYISSH